MRPATSPRPFQAVCGELDRRRRIDLGFERIEALLSLLGHPEDDLPHVVQVVGTNGKGTTAVALAAALTEMGQPSGAYLSPHVLSYVERVLIQDSFVSEDAFATAMGNLIEGADEHGVPATQFELLTAGALAMFRDARISWAVLEAGLGARHDATSTTKPEAVILTNVTLDHTQYLGETVEEIAQEKLASLRPGATLMLGTDDERVMEIVHRETERVGAKLVEFGDTNEEEISTLGLAPYAAHDIALGFRAAEVLSGGTLPPAAKVKAARAVRGALPGRFEEYEVGGVPVVVDGGHNPEALAATLGAVRARYGDRPLGVVFGILQDKDAGTMLSLLGKEARTLVLTRPVGAGDRGAEPAALVREHEPRDAGGRRAAIFELPEAALLAAVEEVREEDGVVLVAGSFYTAASVLRSLREGGLG
ncbi:MAG: bifunctional folylpolyglutamate synthase/dihydrofolate synthase [Rubrobacter sp.]